MILMMRNKLLQFKKKNNKSLFKGKKEDSQFLKLLAIMMNSHRIVKGAFFLKERGAILHRDAKVSNH